MLRDWSIRLRSLFRRAGVERELDDELRSHIERQTEAYEKAGLDRAEAVRRVRAEFGGLDQVKEDCRDARGVRWLEETVQDLRFSARLLKKDRGFAWAVVLVLALGIGVNATIFALVNAVLIRDLPFEHADEVVSIGTRDTRQPVLHGPPGYRGLSYQEYQEWRRSTAAFAGVAAYADATMSVSDDERAPERFAGAYVSGNAFGLLGRQPLIGRDFRREDDQRGARPVVILGYRVWADRYAGDPRIIGQTIRINATPAVVVGVMPPRFGFPLAAHVWQPLAQMPGLFDQPRAARVLDGVGRLAPGKTMAQAQAALDAVADRLSKEFPDTDANVRSIVWPYADRYIASQVRVIIAALMGSVVFVLLIACANVANLLLARATQRSHEISLRASLGATRSRIVRQLLSESLLLAAAGGAAGYGLSIAGGKLLGNVLDGSGRPYWLELTTDVRTLGFLVVLCLGTAVFFGLVPALYMSRTNAYGALKQAPRTSTPPPGVRRWTSALMIAEIALTLVLLGGAGFMMRSFFLAYDAHADFDTAGLLTLRIELPQRKYPTPAQRIAFVQRLEERVGHLRAVTAIASAIPFEFPSRRDVAVDGRAPGGRGTPSRVSVVAISGGFFDALDVHLLDGRRLTSSDGMPGRENAVVNQRFAAMYFPDADPIGRRIRLTNPNARDAAPGPWITVVGVSPAIRRDVTTPGDPVVYLPYRSQPGARLALLVRCAPTFDAIVPQLRQEVRALDPDLPLFDIQTVDDWLAYLRWPERVFGAMFTIFACIGLITAAVGLYAVTVYAVRQRTQEIGVRMALGAPARHVWWLVLRRVIVELAIGLAVGLPGAFIVGGLPWMGSPDPLILTAIVMLVAIVAGLAAFLPARRATRVDPLLALRCE
ncbi:MAG TPA: ABC transporter permease [Vicinamibacterales bacterium]|nr:ABC transporter permease [Vicinamibacterales bacterium]